MMYPTIGEYYCIKKLFMDMFFVVKPEEAKWYLWFWCDRAMDSNIISSQKFAHLIKAHRSGIAAYFDKKVTTGVPEGINSKIQQAKRSARGHRNIKNFVNMIYFLTVKLKFDYPLYLFYSQNYNAEIEYNVKINKNLFGY
jgi:hypothetical protein